MNRNNTYQKNPWFILAGVFILLFLISVDYTAVTIALVAISKEFHTELIDVQWAISGYVLTWSALVVPSGKLADIYGKRRLFLLGVWVFLFASIACGLAPNTITLIIARIFQGIGGALFCTPIYTLTFSAFPKEKQGFAIGMLSVSAGLGLAVGPSLGGFIVSYLGWRWIFFINIPLCILCMLVVQSYVRKDIFEKTQRSFDFLGSLLLAGTLAVLMFGLNKIEILGLKSFQLWGIICVGFLFMVLFLFRQLKIQNPLIPYTLFKDPQYAAAVIGFTLFEVNFGTFFVLLGLYLQNVLKYSALEAGNIFLVFTIALGALSPVGGRLLDRVGARLPICLGLILSGFSFGLAFFLSETSSLLYILTVMLLNGIGMGISFPAFNSLIMKIVDEKDLSIASSVFIMGSTLGNTIGVIGSTGMLVGFGSLQIAALDSSYGSSTIEAVTKYLSSGYRDINALQEYPPNISVDLTNVIDNIFVNSFSSVMLVSLCITAVVFGLSFFWVRYKPSID